MDRICYDWYEILEEQSDVSLVRMALDDVSYDVDVDDPNGFLIVDTTHLPDELKAFLSYDTVKPITQFRHPAKVLLHNHKLSKYLALAKGFKPYRRKYNDYIEVLFEREEKELKTTLADESLDLSNLDNILDNSVELYSCLELFSRLENKELIRQLAIEAEEKLFAKRDGNNRNKKDEKDEKVEYIDEFLIGKIYVVFTKYASLAVVFAWLKDFEKARNLLSKTGYIKIHYQPMKLVVRYYLEILIIHQQEEILAEYFGDKNLREAYLTHYEVYMQTFVDPGFVCTRTQQVKVVRERMEAFKETYY